MKNIKDLFIVAFFVLTLFSIVSANDYPIKGSKSFSIGSNSGLTFKKNISDKTAMYLGFTFNRYGVSDVNVATAKRNNISLSIGVRKYITGTTLKNYIDCELRDEYMYYEHSDVYTNTVNLNISYGIEYFISKNVSIEGKSGANLGYRKLGSGIYKELSFSAPTTNIAVSYYY